MRVAVTIGEATFGGWSPQPDKSAAFTGLGEMALAEPASFVILAATLERTLVRRDAQRLQACDVGGTPSEGSTCFSPLLIVAGAETPGLDNLRTVREGTLAQIVSPIGFFVVEGPVGPQGSESSAITVSPTQLLQVARAQAMGAVPTAAIRKVAFAALCGVQGPQISIGVAPQLFGMGMAKALVDGISVASLPANLEAALFRLALGATHWGPAATES